jgi:very-short-patch-repair endonuclease
MLPKPKHLTEFARENRKSPTKAERLLRNHLRGERFDGLRFRFQYVIADYIVDFCCPRAKVVIELDGWSHDDTYAEDVQRQKVIEEEGFVFLRFDNMDVIRDSASVAESISTHCVERAKVLYGERYFERRNTRERRI